MYVPDAKELSLSPIVFFSLDHGGGNYLPYPMISEFILTGIIQYREDGRITHRTVKGVQVPLVYHIDTLKIDEEKLGPKVYQAYSQRLKTTHLYAVPFDQLIRALLKKITSGDYISHQQAYARRIYDQLLRLGADPEGKHEELTRIYVNHRYMEHEMDVISTMVGNYIYKPSYVDLDQNNIFSQLFTEFCVEHIVPVLQETQISYRNRFITDKHLSRVRLRREIMLALIENYVPYEYIIMSPEISDTEVTLRIYRRYLLNEAYIVTIPYSWV